MKQGEKRKRENITIDLSNVSPDGNWYTIPNVISEVSTFLKVSDVIEHKTLCKNWFKAMNRGFLRKYVSIYLGLDDEKLNELDVVLNAFKSEKRMISSYEGIIESLRILDSDSDYSGSVRSLLDKYDKTPDLEVLQKIYELTKQEIKKKDECHLSCPKIEIDDQAYICENYESIRSIQLSSSNNSVEHHGLDITSMEKEYFVVLSNGYPMNISFDSEFGRYDGHYHIKINNIKLIELDWFEGYFEESHNWKFIKTLRKALDFKSDSTIDNDKVFVTLLFSWLTGMLPDIQRHEIPDRCFGESILDHHELNERESDDVSTMSELSDE